jgi:predicted SAM-dependent methyltransferase
MQETARITTTGLRDASKALVTELRLWRTHRRAVRRAQQLAKTGLQLHLGSGPNRKAGWVNIDLHQNADLMLDLREPLPFPADSCVVVYSEHVLEHFEYPEPAMSMLRDWLRVLAPGGTCRIGVPDTRWPLVEYCGQGDGRYFAIAKEQWHPAWCRTPMEHINYHFRQGREHQFAYDAETLIGALTAAGFVDARQTHFDPEIDSPSRELGTLYVVATKPHAS